VIYLETVLMLAALVFLVPVLVLFLQVVLAFFATRDAAAVTQASGRAAVLIPAHNESAVIAETLATLKPQLRAGDRIVVVADNCSDDTAELVRNAGVEVLERQNLEQRGKGFALDFGVRHLEKNPPDVLVIVDADCQVLDGALVTLIAKAQAAQRPVQALYLMKAPAGSGLKLRLAEFAWAVRNFVRPQGWHNVGLPCQLMGTGMAFPWPMAARMSLANANIVEDMKLGIDLALEGTPPLFCPEAVVTSEFPTVDTAVQSQRTRWEHGHMGMILQEVPRLLRRAVLGGNVRLLGLALDLLVPPLALLVTMLCAVLLVTGVWAFVAGGSVAFALALLACSLMFTAVLLAWLKWGRQMVSGVELLSVPFYVLAKIPLYLRFLTRRQKEWVRTDRK